jgi:hypothetical protein
MEHKTVCVACVRGGYSARRRVNRDDAIRVPIGARRDEKIAHQVTPPLTSRPRTRIS